MTRPLDKRQRRRRKRINARIERMCSAYLASASAVARRYVEAAKKETP